MMTIRPTSKQQTLSNSLKSYQWLVPFNNAPTKDKHSMTATDSWFVVQKTSIVDLILFKMNLCYKIWYSSRYISFFLMNKIVISKREVEEKDVTVFALTYDHANKMLPVLRSDHFKSIVLQDVAEVQAKSLRFLIQLSRLLKNDVQ